MKITGSAGDGGREGEERRCWVAQMEGATQAHLAVIFSSRYLTRPCLEAGGYQDNVYVYRK